MRWRSTGLHVRAPPVKLERTGIPFPEREPDMNGKRGYVVVGILFLASILAGLGLARQGTPPNKADSATVGRYQILDFPVGKFVYRFLSDSASGEHWLWVNGEWERPEESKGGLPWKNLPRAVGRFRLLSQIQGELDLELYVLDTTTGRMWARPARNRAQLFVAEEWREIAPPAPRKPAG